MSTHGGSNSFSKSWPARRIDYIFALDSFEGQPFMELQCQSFRVERQPLGKELSDHWPQIATIVPSLQKSKPTKK